MPALSNACLAASAAMWLVAMFLSAQCLSLIPVTAACFTGSKSKSNLDCSSSLVIGSWSYSGGNSPPEETF
jgi:hypothetical protein